MIVRNKPQHRILLSGDFTLFAIQFFLFDLDVVLARKGIEYVQPYSPYSSASLVKRGKAMRQAKKLLKKTFSTKYNKIDTRDRFVVENITLAQIMKGLEQDVEGIIYIKPLMCTPCDNVGYVLKKEKNFNLPFVEISYDEHSGINGIMTRIDAFVNILDEKV